MKILVLSWEYPPHVVGGLGVHVAQLVPALARAGAEVHVVTPRWKGGANEQVIEGTSGRAIIHRVDPPFGGMGNFFADARQTNLNLQDYAHALWEQVGGFDLIHVHDWLVAFAGASLKRLHKIPLVATIHATERGRGRGNLENEIAQAINGAEWWLAYEAWRVICTSRYMVGEVMNYFQIPSDKIEIVPNGVDTSPFDALDGQDLSEFRARWTMPEERLVFNVGRLVYEKGAHLIVEAAPSVLAQMPQAKFVIAGTGGLSEQLHNRVRELGIAHKVNIAGFITDQDRDCLLRIADVAVYPSLYEPFGIVALEAMAAHCPVIVSSVGGLGEVVQLHETGITVYPNDAASLAWGILHTLQHPDWSRARAENAYRLVQTEYNWRRVAEMTLHVYARVIQERASVDW